MFWSVFYAYLKDGLNVKNVIMDTLKGGPRFGFLCYLIGLYMITPVLNKVIENKKITLYFLLLCVVFSYLIPQIIYLMQFSKQSQMLLIFDILNSTIEKMNMQFVMGMTGYYITGYVLGEYDIPKRIRYVIYFFGVVSAIITSVLTIIESINSRVEVFVWLNYCWINVFFMSVSVFLFIRYCFIKITVKKRVKEIVEKIAKCTFGIYLTHTLVLDKLLPDVLGINANFCIAIIAVPTVVVFVFGISLIISFILNRIPFINKYIV